MYNNAIIGIFITILCLSAGYFYNNKLIKMFSLIVYFFFMVYHNILPVYLICLACVFYTLVNLSCNNKNYLFNVSLILISLIFYFYLQGHIFPEVHNILIAKNILIGNTGVFWNLYVNYDKALMSFIVLIKIDDYQKSKIISYKHIIILLFFCIIAIFTLSLSVNFIKYDFKIAPVLWLWSINNLFMVCVAEEIFFRYFLYNMLVKLNGFKKYNNLVGLLLSSLLFGLFHYSGGIIYMVLAFLAGIIYCLLYVCYGKIQISILGHFILNLLHFIFFSYPKAL